MALLILLNILLSSIFWQQQELIFISDLNHEILCSYCLPKGYKCLIITTGSVTKRCVVFTYPNGATFYVTNDGNGHPNSDNLNDIIPEWGTGVGNMLVDNLLLADPSIQEELHAPKIMDYSGHNFRTRWWRDIQTYDISYGYRNANKQWKEIFEHAIKSMSITSKTQTTPNGDIPYGPIIKDESEQ